MYINIIYGIKTFPGELQNGTCSKLFVLRITTFHTLYGELLR